MWYKKKELAIGKFLLYIVKGLIRPIAIFLFPVLLVYKLPGIENLILILYILTIFLVASNIVLASFYNKNQINRKQARWYEYPAYFVSLIFKRDKNIQTFAFLILKRFSNITALYSLP